MTAQEHEAKELSLYQVETERLKNEELKAIELQEKRHRVNNEWCDYMALIFERYQNENKETKFRVPEATSKILKNNGIEIDGIEEKDIYQAFNIIMQSNGHIEDYLVKQRGKYIEEMPEF